MPATIEAIFAPVEVASLPHRNLSEATCVVFDILRATSVFVTALANGAKSVRAVGEVPEALATRAADPSVLLAGERHGLRIRAPDTGSMDFDLGNSPREFTPQAVANRKIVSTTTNGTRALRACAGAARVFAGSLLNVSATANHLARLCPPRLLLVCAGTGEAMALEDVVAAGALCSALETTNLAIQLEDSAEVARRAFQQVESQLEAALAGSRNGRRLTQNPELRDDVAFCARRDVTQVVVAMNAAGVLSKI
jgi:2-phosphosulfolactate phosphatase